MNVDSLNIYMQAKGTVTALKICSKSENSTTTQEAKKCKSVTQILEGGFHFI